MHEWWAYWMDESLPGETSQPVFLGWLYLTRTDATIMQQRLRMTTAAVGGHPTLVSYNTGEPPPELVFV